MAPTVPNVCTAEGGDEEDFRCAGGRADDTEVAAFNHDIWSI
jgi:hypothetical protein